MEENKRNPIGYRNSTRMEAENRMNDEQTAQGATSQSANAQEQAARDHFENGGWQDAAREVFEDTERTNDLLDKEEEFSNKKGLSRVRRQLRLLWAYLRAVVSGEYTDYSAWACVKAVAGLLYVVSPLDLIPDFFPWVGWADDVLVVMYVCNLLHNELEKFAAWQAAQLATAKE